MKLFQPFTRDVSINLGGRKVTMSEQQLDDPQVGPVVKQMGRK